MTKKNSLVTLPTIAILILGIIGATLLTPKLVSILDQVLISRLQRKPEYRLDAPSEVLPLANQSAQERRERLEEIASQKQASLDRSRAKYLIASDILREDYDGGKAMSYLKNLEKEYSILAPYILLRQGRAYELSNNEEQAEKTWLKLVKKYPDSLVSAEAYYKLGSFDPEYWQEAIAKYPQSPRTQDMARELLKEDPQNKELLLLLAQYDLSRETKPILDQLVRDFGKELKPEEWDIIANNYWKTSQFALVPQTYKKGTSSAQNLYRIARSYQIAKKEDEAKNTFLTLVEKYPQAPETGLALRRLATLTSGEEAVSYLNKVDDKFPIQAPKALIQKIQILTKQGKSEQAVQAQDQLLTKYSQSEEAAKYRWSIASKLARTNNYISAWQWAQEITVNNPESSVAPKAAFWVGKWAEKLDQQKEAQKVYRYVLDTHPNSYYAWRSAVRLGKDVGDFNTVRDLDLKVDTPETRPIPPAGSSMFKELFLLGEDRDAIDLFQGEIAGKDEISVSEQFSQGLLKQVQGQYLQSINLIWDLSNRDEPEDYREWQMLRKSPEYWYALFPFPYKELVVKWSEKRDLNPFLVISLIRQESRFERLIQSPVGATGLMQVMPDTGEWIAPQIELEEYSLTDPEDNINMGTWYLDHTHKTYNNNSMLAIASYNAGPGNVSEWTKRYSLDDVDEFVENIPFPETKKYIETVFSNYWNYVELYNPQEKAPMISQNNNTSRTQ